MSITTPPDWTDLRRVGAHLDDIQSLRIRSGNRTGAALRSGHEHISDEVMKTTLENLEHEVALSMRRLYRVVAPGTVVDWQKATPGIGEHLLARLLGYIGHPVIATPHHWEGTGTDRVLVTDEPYHRTVAQLWAYCGHGDPARRIKAGATAEDLFRCGNPKAKMVTHLLAEACMKCRTSPYRVTYDDAREEYLTREDWTKAHQHAAALRLVGKELLRDLWGAAAKSVLADPLEDAA